MKWPKTHIGILANRIYKMTNEHVKSHLMALAIKGNGNEDYNQL